MPRRRLSEMEFRAGIEAQGSRMEMGFIVDGHVHQVALIVFTADVGSAMRTTWTEQTSIRIAALRL